MSTNVSQIPIAGQQVIAPPTNDQHLFGPKTDFLLLGGGSLIFLVLIRYAAGIDWATSFFLTMMLANIVNHPHFAHSYQIFYRDFGKKLTSYPAELRWRYLVCGIVVPLVLISFFASTVLSESPRVLGIAVNLMGFFVGWHYVKQGYGMAMVDAVLKKAFYSDSEKKALLRNAYATWLLSWLAANYILSTDRSYFGISYFAIPIPVWVVGLAGALSAYTTLKVFSALKERRANGKPIAWNGLISYIVSLYVWLLMFREPVMALWIPLFHSLQYLAVVWRFETNRSRSIESTIRPGIRFWLFIAIGIGLGYLGFWMVPNLLNAYVPYSKELFGPSLFLFIFWIFINVHHYFLDAVMWRRGNPDVQAHLFSHQAKALNS
jgi:hypothetical protein